MILVSDNGASGEGGPDGSVNENLLFNGIPDDIQRNLAMIGELGGTKTYNHYSNGWAMAFNAPFKMWKRYGGTSEGLCVGRDSGATVTDDYPWERPYRFIGGTIKRVVVDVSGTPYLDLERQAAAMLARE